MGRKKKVEGERTCDNCRFGPEGQSDDCDDCEDHDAWQPKEEANIDTKAHGERLSKGLDAIKERHDNLPDDCKISVNGGPAVPFPSKEAEEQVTGVVKKHLEDQGLLNIAKDGLEELEALRKRNSKQLDLEGKPAEFPVNVEAEEFTTLAFECGSWSLKVREDRLQRAYEDDKVTALVQRRLKASNDMYPLKHGEFDRWVERFARSLESYLRTGCA